MTEVAEEPIARRLAAPDLRAAVERYVRRKVPRPDVEDVVQTVLCDALAAEAPPRDERALKGWLVGIARHKVADYHRSAGRARHVELDDHDGAAEPAASAHDWARWAQEQTARDPEAERTLGWMAREGGGEKLAHIAAEERLPAEQVRQRVSRLRRWMRDRWLAELAAVAGIGAVALVAWWLWETRRPDGLAVPALPVPRIELAAPPAPSSAERPAAEPPSPAPPVSSSPPAPKLEDKRTTPKRRPSLDPKTDPGFDEKGAPSPPTQKIEPTQRQKDERFLKRMKEEGKL
jgi:DNA-directed RNA polymerase specialized sigma24 family protein